MPHRLPPIPQAGTSRPPVGVVLATDSTVAFALSFTERPSEAAPLAPQTGMFEVARSSSYTAALVVALTMLAGGAHAQSVVNPRIVEFDPSADHATLLEGGQPVVTEYALELYLQGAVAPFYTMSLGKPAPQADGKIRFDFSTNVAAWPLPGGTYESRVAAVGPTGTGRSDPSNTFSFATACSYTLAPTSATVGAASGSSSLSVTTTSGCAWTATTTASWVSLITTSGTGSGTVSFSYSTNSTTAARAATISVGGKSYTLTQSAAAACSYTASPGSFALPSTASATNTITVTAATGCAWMATTGTPWITMGTASGSGNGTATFTIAANPDGTPRTGSIILGGRTVSVAQAAASCGVSVSPKTISVGARAGAVNVAVSTATGCAWSATSGAAWVTPGSSSGSGAASLVLTYAAHTGSAPRATTVVVGGVSIPFTQQVAVVPTQPKNLRVVTSQ